MLTNQPLRWRKIAGLEQDLEKVIDGDLTKGLSLTWSAAERCVILIYHIYRAGQDAEVKVEFEKLLAKIKKGRDPIEKLVRHELNNLPPQMKGKVMGVQSQIVAALHLIDREIGEDTIPEDAAIQAFINNPTAEGGCGGLEKCRLTWLHVIADETRKQRAATSTSDFTPPVKRGRGRPRLPDHVILARQAIAFLKSGKTDDAIIMLDKIVKLPLAT